MAGDYKAGPCISRDRLEHHIRQQYTPNTFKLREIRARLAKADTSCADPLYCPLRSLQNEFSYSSNSVSIDWNQVDRRIKAAAEISKSYRENY